VKKEKKIFEESLLLTVEKMKRDIKLIEKQFCIKLSDFSNTLKRKCRDKIDSLGLSKLRSSPFEIEEYLKKEIQDFINESIKSIQAKLENVTTESLKELSISLSNLDIDINVDKSSQILETNPELIVSAIVVASYPLLSFIYFVYYAIGATIGGKHISVLVEGFMKNTALNKIRSELKMEIERNLEGVKEDLLKKISEGFNIMIDETTKNFKREAEMAFNSSAGNYLFEMETENFDFREIKKELRMVVGVRDV